MNDDDFSGLVRSGSQHSVSVSEHTGNAKTPKNMVVSHEEETEARKRAFEEKALAALDAEKALADALAEHTEHVLPDDTAADANIQIAASKEAVNRQGIAGDAAAKPNVQNISTDVFEANHQKVGTDKIQDNIQSVGNGKGIASNVQDIPVGGIAANVQGIGNGPAAAANLQTLPADDVSANRQSVGQDGNAKNQQGIPTDGISTNEQKLAKLGVQDNLQAVVQDSFSTHRQSLAPEPSMAPNNQAIGTDAPTLNRQAAPQDAPPGINRQGVGNDKIESHFETLPSTEVVRKKVDFPSGASATANTKAAPPTAVKPGQTPRTLMTAAEQQEAKLKREQMNDAFHGRLAGIKHNVDALNHRLSDLEDKVHKEDANLVKGNPEDFDIELD